MQWLGEHLIQQSILFEGNPDTTNIQEKFRYKHEANPPRTLVQQNAPAQSAPVQPPAPSPQIEQNTPQTVVVPDVQPAQTPAVEAASANNDIGAMEDIPQSAPETTSTPAPATNVNGTADNPPDQVQDTEMSNAP